MCIYIYICMYVYGGFADIYVCVCIYICVCMYIVLYICR